MVMEFPSIALKGTSLGEMISSELRLKIINKSIAPGTVLSENSIAEEFGTSRSPVREALKTLSNEGLIRLERMGAVVLGLSRKDIEELYDVRYLIETFVIERLSKMENEDLIKKLNKILDEMIIAAKYNQYIEFTIQDLKFHELMIEAAEHKRMLHLWNNIRDIVFTALLVATKKRFLEQSNEINSLIEKHRVLINSIVSKDLEFIKNVVHDHFEDTRETVTNSIF
ncbi:GntR family transcriptional regulator [Bacillus sp. HNG]|uniref:GntR family transcriptional regulator n=1 Tax=Bacillus sp. HNG TaxID=2293325 RepID=UPI0029500684|nr:GntR family transcriptional regulator [Bacillus sp. HNG]